MTNEGILCFTEAMKATHTILVPQMAPFHFEFIVEALRMEGYKAELLKNDDADVIAQGIQYVHNDACYPAILAIGQTISALKSGKYDLNQVALIMTQTGGGCRASNYIHLQREALKRAGLSHVPVVSLNINKLEKHPGFRLSLNFWLTAFNSVILGDLLHQLYNQTLPYAIDKEACYALRDTLTQETCRIISTKRLGRTSSLKALAARYVDSFETLSMTQKSIPKIGIVGEIYLKYSPLGNNQLEGYLLDQGVEPVVLPMLDFFLFKLDYRAHEVTLYGGNPFKKMAIGAAIWFIDSRRQWINTLLQKSRYRDLGHFDVLKACATGLAGRGNRMGEGWLLTAEMVHLIKEGIPNIICAQPFGCLPNHITGKGTLKAIREAHPSANIVAIDYDPGASKANQENRIKLMLNYAWEQVSGDGISCPVDQVSSQVELQVR